MTAQVVVLINGEFYTRTYSHHVDSCVDALELDGLSVDDVTYSESTAKDNTWGVPVVYITTSAEGE